MFTHVVKLCLATATQNWVKLCRNSRLVVDEDDLNGVINKKKILLLLKEFHENFGF